MGPIHRGERSKDNKNNKRMGHGVLKGRSIPVKSFRTVGGKGRGSVISASGGCPVTEFFQSVSEEKH